jgi:di/tricarboxylate transporter
VLIPLHAEDNGLFEAVQVQVLIVGSDEALRRNISERLHLMGAMVLEAGGELKARDLAQNRGILLFGLAMTNFIMNVAAIAISLPVSLVIAKYLGVAPDVILHASLVTRGMPFVLRIGAAPNAIAYESEQFTTGEFMKHGMIMSVVLMLILAIALVTIWPLFGMDIVLK